MIEIEKKYRLDKESFESIKGFLEKTNGYFSWVDKEENILYSGVPEGKVLRVRNVNRLLEGKPGHKNWTILTVKDTPTMSEDGTKARKELETSINPDFIPALESLGYKPSVVYEKIRYEFNPATHRKAIVCLDELPFGYYMEIEGTEEQIKEVEDMLEWDLSEDVEFKSYPQLTQELWGSPEARFLG